MTGMKPRITKENAAEMGRLGGLASWQKKVEAAARQMEARELEALALSKHKTFEGRALARTRLQLDEVFKAFMAECAKANPDAAKLDRLAAAQSRLAEQERVLDGRPMPGSLRPSAKSKPTNTELPEPE